MGGLRATKLDRRAAAGAGRPVASLGGGSCQVVCVPVRPELVEGLRQAQLERSVREVRLR